MAAYIVAQLNMRDMAWRAEYGPKAGALVRKHGGKVLAGFGNTMEHLEGEQLPDALVLIEFPSLEHAKAWYNDPDYAPMITLRQTGSDTNMLVIEGR
jgi:uncharacterized protein (DUF1330 family)